MKPAIVIIAMLTCFCVSAQNTGPLKIGDKVPEYIWKNIPKKKNTKLVILDFWTTTCLSCIAAFPKMEQLQNAFDKELQVVFVNAIEDSATISQRFNKLNRNRTKDKWIAIPKSISTINGSKVYAMLFPHQSVPHHIWINGEGKVLFITDASYAISKNVEAVLNGKQIVMKFKDDKLESELKFNGYLRPVTDALNSIYYSAFVSFSSGGSGGRNHIDTIKGIFRKTEFNYNPIHYFLIAYRHSGEDNKVLYELKNKEMIVSPRDEDLREVWNEKYRFTYELQCRLVDKDKWQEKLQIDANYFFGNLFGIEAFKEKRKYNSLVLVKLKDGLMKTIVTKKGSKSNDTLRIWVNSPFNSVVNYLQMKFEDMENGRPFIDGTNFTGDVDIQLTGNLKDLQNVKKQLQQYGLDIIEAEKEVEVLVIRDKKTNN